MGYNYTIPVSDPYKTHVYYSNFARYGGDIYILQSVLFCVKATRYYTSLTVTKSAPDNTNCNHSSHYNTLKKYKKEPSKVAAFLFTGY